MRILFAAVPVADEVPVVTEGQIVANSDITGKSLKDAKVEVAQASYVFSGKEQEPEVTRSNRNRH